MIRTFAILLPGLFIGLAGQAATTNTTLTVTNAPVTIGATIGVAGTATLSNIGSGAFTLTASLTSLNGAFVTAPFTIALSGGNLTGNMEVPLTLLAGGATTGTGSAAITGGTGTYAGATGSFASLTGTVNGSLLSNNLTLSITGDGTITTSGGTGGGGTTPPPANTPTITAVQDAGSYTSNIAEGSIFVVKGSNLSASGYTAFGFPLPTASSGSDKAQITFTPTAGGSGTAAYLIYTYNENGTNQLAAILPSTLAAGSYNVTVTANGATSAPFAATVVQRKAELFTGDASGSGLVLAQNVVTATQYDINRFTTGTVGGFTISPAHPGQTMVAYATGLGPVSGGDNVASSGFDFTQNGVTVQVIVGGMSIPALYAGRTPSLAGLDQINFTLPSNIPTGCTESFQISVNGVLSAPTFVAIAPNAGAAACVEPGYTAQQLQDFDNGKTITGGSFSLTQLATSFNGTTYKVDSLAGGFAQITGFQLAAAALYNVSASTVGSCQVYHLAGLASNPASGATVTGLDAGTVTFSGPNISATTVPEDPSTKGYSLSLGTEGISIPGQISVTLGPGTYTINGAGGKDVGAFKASIAIGSPLAISGGLPASINRSAGLTLNWTGGNSSDFVEISGYSGNSSGSGANATTDATYFVCTTTAGAGTFTVPPAVLTQLPASTNTGTSTGYLEVTSGPTPVTFNAPLTAGGSVSNASFLALVGAGAQAAYQ